MRRSLAALGAVVVLAASPGAVTAAASPQAAPSTALVATEVWRPAPAAAATDLPPVYGRCHAGVTVTAATACVFGDLRSRRTVVLIGDSHAANWVPGLISAAVSNHWRFVSITKTTCPAMPVRVTLSTSLTSPTPYSQCATWRRNVLRTVASWRPTVVIVAGSHSTRMIAPDGRPYPNTTAGLAQRDSAWRAATTSLLHSLGTVVPRADVLVVHDVPIARSNVVACVIRYGRTAGTACAVPLSYAVLPGVRAAEIAALPANPRARVVDPLTALCSGGTCIPAARGILRYRNAGHLTATFSRSVAWIWRTVLTRVLTGLPKEPVLWPVAPPPPTPTPTPTPT
jgi:hypothetical protein